VLSYGAHGWVSSNRAERARPAGRSHAFRHSATHEYRRCRPSDPDRDHHARPRSRTCADCFGDHVSVRLGRQPSHHRGKVRSRRGHTVEHARSLRVLPADLRAILRQRLERFCDAVPPADLHEHWQEEMRASARPDDPASSFVPAAPVIRSVNARMVRVAPHAGAAPEAPLASPCRTAGGPLKC
jgi:hypothetical protein